MAGELGSLGPQLAHSRGFPEVFLQHRADREKPIVSAPVGPDERARVADVEAESQRSRTRGSARDQAAQ